MSSSKGYNKSTKHWCSSQDTLAFKQYSRFSDWVLVVEGPNDRAFYKNYCNFLEIIYPCEDFYLREDLSLCDMIDKIDNNSTREKIVCIISEKEKSGKKHFYGIIDEDYHKIKVEQLTKVINTSVDDLTNIITNNIRYSEPNSLETMMLGYDNKTPFEDILTNTGVFVLANKKTVTYALQCAYIIGQFRAYIDKIENDSWSIVIREIANHKGLDFNEMSFHISFDKFREEHYSNYFIGQINNKYLVFDKERYYNDWEKKLDNRFIQISGYLHNKISDRDLCNSLIDILSLRKEAIKQEFLQALNKEFIKQNCLSICNGHDVLDFLTSIEYHINLNANKKINDYVKSTSYSLIYDIISEYVKTENFNTAPICDWLKEKFEDRKNEFTKQNNIVYLGSSLEYKYIFIDSLKYFINNKQKYSYLIFGINKDGKKEMISYVLNIDEENKFKNEDFYIWFTILKEHDIHKIKEIETTENIDLASIKQIFMDRKLKTVIIQKETIDKEGLKISVKDIFKNVINRNYKNNDVFTNTVENILKTFIKSNS